MKSTLEISKNVVTQVKKNNPYKRLKEFACYAVDFETFTAEGEYYQKNNRTDVYCVCAKSIEIKYNSSIRHYQAIEARVDRKNKMKGFANIGDYIKEFSHGEVYGDNQIHFFHNGMGFDFAFIEDWLQEQPDFQFLEDNEQYLKELIDTQSSMIAEFKFYDFNKNLESNMIFINLYLPYYAKGKWKYTKIKFYDSLKYFPSMSIREMGETLLRLNPDKYKPEEFRKPEFDMNKVTEIQQNYQDLPEDVKVRCEADVRILAEFLKNIFNTPDFLPDGTEIPMTPAKLTLRKILGFWKKKYHLEKNKKNMLFNVLECSDMVRINQLNSEFLNRKWYRGGICTYHPVFKHGKVVKKRINSFDVNSLYPSVMMRYLPVGLPEVKTSIDKNDIDKKYIFVHIKADKIVQNDQEKLPPFLSEFWQKSKLETITEEVSHHIEVNVDVDEYNLAITEEREKDHYFYHLSKVDFCVGLAEYNILEKMCTYTNKKVEYLVFKRKKLFDDFINYYYPKKVECGKDPDKILLKITFKLFLNSGYGKFGQKVIMEIGVLLCDREAYEKKKAADIRMKYGIRKNNRYAHYTVEDRNKNSYVPLAAAITSEARSVLLSKAYEISLKGYTVYYTDTDSIKTDCPPEEFNDVDNEALGKWKNEGWVDYFKVFKPKFYFGSQDGVNVYKNFKGSAGIKKEDMEKYKFNEIKEDMTVPVKLKKRVKGGYVLIDGEKQIKQLKRRF